MGTQGEDLLLSPAARKVWPFYTEVKNVESLNIHKAIEQAREGSRVRPANDGSQRPIAVVFRKNSTNPCIALPLGTFLRILRRADHGTEGVLGAEQ